jgi:hypothetical protein
MALGRKIMKVVYILVVSLLFSTFLQAQDKKEIDQKVTPGIDTAADTAAVQKRVAVHSEVGVKSHWHSIRDSIFYTKYNKYGDLKDDDPEFNLKKPWWFVAFKVLAANAAITSFDRYALKQPNANVGFNSWKHNLKTGWEWDTDRFGMNFFFHPYGGGGYYNSAISSGYSFYEAIPFAIAGSLSYEYFGENSLPSYNDFINTPVSGAFIGEVFYRLSSNILDDRATGFRRVFLEFASGAINPTRAFGRLMSGKAWRHTENEVYQKEPLNIALSSGLRKTNNGSSFGTGSGSLTFNIHLDYGNPFELRSRKPYDFFKMRTDMNFGVGRKILDNINGYGLLYGNNVQVGSMEMLIGFYQHFDYWDNKTFELGTMAFGGGAVTKLPLSKNVNLYTNLHLDIVPFAGNSTQYGPDTSQFRDYNYGGGLGGKLESTLEFGRRTSATFIGYYYWIRTYVGHKGDHYIAIIRPRIEVRCINNLSLGFEHLVFYSDRYPADFHPIHFVRTEQRLFLKLYFEQFMRKG